MSYKKIGTRGTLPKYGFYVRHNGVRYRHTVVCPSGVVRDFYRKWENEVFSGYAIGKRLLFETLDQYMGWAEANKSAAMLLQERRNVQDMKEFFGDRELAGIRRPDIEDFRSWRVKQKVKPATVNRTLSTVSYFFNWCKMREYVPGNPAFKVLLKVQNDRVVSLEAGEVNEMLQAADPYQKMWLMLGLFTGMRRGEILKARWEDIDFNAGVIRVEAANAKSKKSRVIHMPGNLIQYLKDLRLESPISGNIVLYQGNPVQEVKHSWQAFNKKLTFPKAKGLRFHDMRHIYATMLRRQGVPLDVLMELLGHASMKMVLRYAAYDPSVQEAHVNKITDFLAQTRAG